MVKLQDILDAEKDLESAEEELRNYSGNPHGWSGSYESLTRDGRKELNLTSAHFEKSTNLRRRIEIAHDALVGLKSAWLKGA